MECGSIDVASTLQIIRGDVYTWVNLSASVAMVQEIKGALVYFFEIT